ncbi:Ionotropic receptor 607 [Blattella germanica]|nr:Ionotropic receptor 607 [Blattella germanica]
MQQASRSFTCSNMNLSRFLVTLIIASVSADSGLLSFQHNHILNCLQEILKNHFSSIMPIFVSFSSSCPVNCSRNLNISFSVSHDLDLVNEVLTHISNVTTVLSYQSELNEGAIFPYDGILEQGYFVFLSSCQQNEGEYDGLINDLETQFFYIIRSFSFNPRAKYVLIVSNNQETDIESLAFELVKTFWSLAKMVNFILVINGLDAAQQHVLNIYTWYPYFNGACNEVDKVVLVDQWKFSDGGHFSRNSDLFSYNFPKSVDACSLVVASVGPEPYVVFLRNYTNEDGNPEYEVEGVSLNLITLFGKDYNFTIIYRPPITDFNAHDLLFEISLIFAGSGDILTGLTPLVAPAVAMADITFPIFFESILWLIPCPQPLGRIERVVGIFTASAWATMISVIFFASAVLLLQAKHYKKEVNGFKSFPQCLSGAWAVLLGVSVPEQPLTSNTRNFFLLYVWYSVAISMVFQAFFVTYLVEPGYKEKMITLEDLQRSNLSYASVQTIDFLLTTTTYTDHYLIPKLKEDLDFYKCSEMVMFNHNLSTMGFPLVAYFIAEKRAVREINKVVCFLEERLFYAAIGMGLVKGNPLVPVLNEYFSRCIEAGFQENYWSMLKYRTRLKAQDIYDEELMYFVFSMQHLNPVFLLHFFGCIVSAVMFAVELIVSRVSSKLCK